MTSERVQRQIDHLLDAAEAAIAKRDWAGRAPGGTGKPSLPPTFVLHGGKFRVDARKKVYLATDTTLSPGTVTRQTHAITPRLSY
jgi:hypothetical protein